MTDRVSSTGGQRSANNPRSPGRAAQPTEQPGMDNAAAEFAALLGADSDNTSTRPNTTDQHTPANSDLEADGAQGKEVEERGDDGQNSEGESGEQSGENEGRRQALPTAGDAILQAFSKSNPTSVAG